MTLITENTFMTAYAEIVELTSRIDWDGEGALAIPKARWESFALTACTRVAQEIPQLPAPRPCVGADGKIYLLWNNPWMGARPTDIRAFHAEHAPDGSLTWSVIHRNYMTQRDEGTIDQMIERMKIVFPSPPRQRNKTRLRTISRTRIIY